ncbi:MAG: isoprenylcysteine carboxylmethyltransferase family protein [Novosphingobium sp.]|nr:isoprenylcysteine carboxylmethyltransferase family protein [Novosphingobium sp.]
MSCAAPVADQRPVSDVSSGVGLAGLFGLFLWIAICRNWAGIAELLAIPGPRAPLAGPYAALATIAFTSAPMIAWSLLVDKVHLRRSTGLDWTRQRSLAATFDISVIKIAGLWATFAIIGCLYGLARWYWSGQYLFAMEVLAVAAVPLFVLTVPYVLWLDRYLTEPRDGAWHFGAMLIGREPYDIEEVKAHFRSWAVKGFFCAFMISILPGGFAYIVNLDISALAMQPAVIATAMIELLFLIDVHMAMVGYLLTIKPLDAHIRSANPYLAGWLAALLCYPPFILMGDGGPLNYHLHTSDWGFWLQDHPVLLWVWAGWLVFLTAIYAWATVIFGIRFSNLTYRGIITNGPYRFTRHPAYLSKNLFWWFGTMPFLVTSDSLADAVRNTALLALVSAVYYWRAKTEERHLGDDDPKYRKYSSWMSRNAAITRGLSRLAYVLRPQRPQLQAAE